MTKNKTTILNDKAIESLKDDALDFTPYVQALADICMTGSTPLTIGVFGTWGSGKTSLMRMVKEQVESAGAVASWFDAWKYDKEETLWRAFLLSVLFSLEDVAKKNNQPVEEIEKLKTLLYQPIDIEKTGGVTIDLVKLGGKAMQGAVQIGLSFIPGGTALGKIIEELQKSGITNLTDGALDAIQRERTKIHIEQIRFLEQFQERFRKIVAESVVRNNNGRLVVFVDDLDRCLPEKAIEVLEAIKLFVDAPGCVFVLGLDQEVIARGVELRYHEFFKNGGQNPIDGAKYLEKIIQLPFQIPPVERMDMDEFVNGLSDNWPHDDCPKIFAEGLGNNPRQIKRTVNVFLMLWSLAEKRRKKLEGSIKPVRLAKIVAIQTVAPVLYDLLKEQPGLLRDLELYFLARIEEQDAAQSKQKPINRFSAIEVGEQSEQISENAEATIRQQKPNPKLPDDLLNLIAQTPAVQRVLIIKHSDEKDATFGELTPLELRMYFTLTKRAEASQSALAEAPRLLFEPQMVTIPAGKFLMGSTKEQAERAIQDGAYKNWVEYEQPQHEVELSEYFIGKYPVTNREYQVFIGEIKHKAPQGWDGENYPAEKSDHPVVNLSWSDAQEYCKWLSQKTGKNYRLPTETEWEKAARGPSTNSEDGRIWPWGNDFGQKNANTVEMNLGDTSPVGQFSPQGDSPYGCADLSGNVWEWCADWFDENEYKNRKPGAKNPPGPQNGSSRVLRGGSFRNDRYLARCTGRGGGILNFLTYFGFRVVLLPSLNLNSETAPTGLSATSPKSASD